MSCARPFRQSLGVGALCLTAATWAGCSTPGLNSGDGGSAGIATGGSTVDGTGGSNASGSGGIAASGGSASSGAPNSGGSAGSSGRANVAGSAGSSGVTGSGGAGAMGGSSNAGNGDGGLAGAMAGSGGSVGRGGTGNRGGAAGVSGATAGGATGVGGGAGGLGGASGTGGTASTCPPATLPSTGTKYCSNSKGNVNGGYAYELWSDGTGTGCMTVYGSDAKFSATWTNAGDFLARIGLGFDQSKTPSEIGTIGCDFAETKTGDTGLVYVGIYGWTVSPLREYYILDDWGSTKPGDTASDGTPRTHVGTISVDGDTYDVWKHTQTNKPAITGSNQTFDQYFSVRQTARQCGHISISAHFSGWTGLSLQLGKLEEAKLLVEAQDGTGTIGFTTATLVVK